MSATATDIEICPNGRLLAAGGGRFLRKGAGELKVWEIESGNLIHDLSGHRNCVWTVAFHPDGLRLAVAGGTWNEHEVPGEMKIWDIKHGHLLLDLAGHSLTVMDVAFSHDGRLLASASEDGTVRIWGTNEQPEQLSVRMPAGEAVVTDGEHDAGTRRPRPNRATNTNDTDHSAGERELTTVGSAPAPHFVVQKMLEMAQVKESERVLTLPGGDGRIAISAAQKYGCRAVGFEANETLAEASRKSVREAGVEELVTILADDPLAADLADFDVLALTLSADEINLLAPKLDALKSGARVISYQIPLPNAAGQKSVRLPSEKRGSGHLIYLWTVP